MSKKVVIAVVVVVFVLALLLVLGLRSSEPSSDTPADWVESNNGVTSIDVFEATSGSSAVTKGVQNVPFRDGEVAGVYLTGVFQGEVFRDLSFSESGDLQFRITRSMIPGDGVPEAFMFARTGGTLDTPFVDGVYVYVDSDWREQASQLNVLWSTNASDLSSFQTRAFDFSQESDGVFFDVITGDFSWALQSQGITTGRVLIGDITLDDIRQETPAKTFVMAS